MLYGLGDLLPPTHGRAIGVGEGHVFCVGEEVLHRLGVASQKLPLRSVILLDSFVDIIDSGHNLSFHRRSSSSLCSSPTRLYRTFARKRETGHHASVLASVAGRTTGSASSLIGCHVLQWDGLLGLYPYWPFLCHKDNYSNAAITVHPTSRMFMQHHKM